LKHRRHKVDYPKSTRLKAKFTRVTKGLNVEYLYCSAIQKWKTNAWAAPYVDGGLDVTSTAAATQDSNAMQTFLYQLAAKRAALCRGVCGADK
jgi:hypothetical protein